MMGDNVKTLGSRLQTLWCKSMHPAPMWPVKGRYQCPVCLRSYEVPWERSTVACKRAPAQPVRNQVATARSTAAAVAAAASN